MRDPVKDFFQEKLQMIFSSNHTGAILKRNEAEKRQTLDTIESLQTLIERKELRVKKFDFDTRIQSDDFGSKEREIKNLIDKHEMIDNKIHDHYKKEVNQQEDQFQKKLKERKDRSMERSLSRSVDVGSKRTINKKVYGEDKEGSAPALLNLNGTVQGSATQSSSQKEAVATKENDIQTELLLKGSDVNPDSFSYKKLSALNAKLSKMKMFNQEFDNANEKEEDSRTAAPLKELKVPKNEFK